MNLRHALGREHRTVGLAVLVGSLTGLGVAVFDRIVAVGLFDRLARAPLAVQVAMPLVGLSLAAAALHLFAHQSDPSTADEYIRNFHDRSRRMDLRPVAGRLLASAFTLGSGVAMGFEGPSIYLGASIGTGIQQRASRWFSRDEAKVLMVAGAAAGVAAIFKAPATGALFALEVPYQADLARRMLLPALFSAASGYVVFAAINGTEALFPIQGAPNLDLRDLAAAVAIGLIAGGAARGFAYLVREAKVRSALLRPVTRVVGSGVAIGALVLLSQALTGDTLALGPGYRTIAWSIEPDHAVGIVLGLLVIRAAATILAVGGGGVGGLFIPLVIEGALLGRAVGGVVGAPSSVLFPVLGVAAFLGAGYRVPLAAVMFVAESTGKPGFVVPGLIAAAASQITMGPRSVSVYQQARHPGHLEGRLDLPLTSVVRTEAATVPSDASVADFVGHHLLGVRLLEVPVVDGAAYLGMIGLADVTSMERSRWADTAVADVMRTDQPVVQLSGTVRHALAEMEAGDTERLAVLDGAAYVGIVTMGEILKLGEILGATEAAS